MPTERYMIFCRLRGLDPIEDHYREYRWWVQKKATLYREAHGLRTIVDQDDFTRWLQELES